MALSLRVLATSSKGNAYVISSGHTNLLLDVGVSARQIQERMRLAGVNAASLDGILLTHYHKSDHARGIDNLVRMYRAPVYCSAGSRAALLPDCTHLLAKDCHAVRGCFTIGDIAIETFDVDHDAPEPFGYVFRYQDQSIAVATDLGKLRSEICEKIAGADVLFLESNYDVDLVGCYEASLAVRVRENHLSNDQVARFITNRLGEQCQTLILGHISSNTNTDELARLHATVHLRRRGHGARLIVGESEAIGQLVRVLEKQNGQSITAA